jgi:glycosyltransferase involved in cell wall biosynthesis
MGIPRVVTPEPVAGSATAQPMVSIVIPAYNEAQHIERVVSGFLATGYPNLVEILVGDGRSTDQTREIVARLAAADPRVRLIDNPRKVQSAALNLMLAACKGEVYLRADAHCDYAPDYVERCVEALVSSGSLNAGGAQRFVATTDFQAAMTLSSRSLLGSGGARYRDPRYDGTADTVFLGCFWTRSLRELGAEADARPHDGVATSGAPQAFDETQITNQDAELNHRLRARDPRAIYVSSRIRAWYYPRKTWKTLAVQYFKYGRGRCLSGRGNWRRVPLRSRLVFLLPLAALVLLAIDRLALGGRWHVLPILAAGAMLPFLEGLRLALAHRSTFAEEHWRGSGPMPAGAPFRWVPLVGIVLLTMPAAHFAGYAYQLYRRHVRRVERW